MFEKKYNKIRFHMNKPKFTFGAIKLNVAKSTDDDKKKDEPEVSGKLS